ncbi:Type II secretory pathway, pullulanase [Photobacterium marinum]|uniref:Type II secretory pathway, pullulanase n=1 Tax=Photobacterium marinum TaxID=1056511 RepID=L8JBK5_9GAMM|nr:pullulanase-type alpha-1,6-glucosidase [Photobacterium marinum]ELR65653.1 Type II secretory pathway, pullulanase [Photobacterium marinum]
MNFKLSTIAKVIIPLCSAVAVVGCNGDDASPTNKTDGNGKLVTISKNQAAIYFKLKDQAVTSKAATNQYEGYSLHIWNDDTCGSYDGEDTDWNKGLPLSGVDEEQGAYWIIDLKEDTTQCVNFIPRDSKLNKPLGDFNAKLDLNQVHNQGNYVFTKEGVPAVFPELIPALANNTSRIYINLDDGDYSDITLHVWNNEKCSGYAGADTGWGTGLPVTGISETYGAYWDLATNNHESHCINFIPHIGDSKPLVSDTVLDISKASVIADSAFTFEGSSTVYYQPMAKQPQAQLSGASAHWLTSNILALPSGAAKVELIYARDAGIQFDSKKLAFTEVDKVITAKRSSDKSWSNKYRYLKEYDSWELDFEDAKITAKELLKGQLYAASYDASGKLISATQVQPAGALDDIYAATADDLNYGAIVSDSDVTFRVWAPTARSVSVVKYSQQKNMVESLPMTFDEQSGSWSLNTGKLKANDYYRYKINVYHPAVKEMREYEVTDPYSLSLSMNSEFSQVVDLNDSSLKPDGWDALKRPVKQDNPAEFVIYESHVRDFSALDQSTPVDLRGKYGAFTQSDAAPVKHLKSLKASGVTHLHLLPFFDIATINEDPAKVAEIDQPFSKLCDVNSGVKESRFKQYCSSEKTIADVLETIKADDSPSNPVVQELNRFVSQTDGFNWGYDPFHYTVPEGSYSTNADGTKRILELREAIKAVKENVGMNVVMDVVYNHTNSAGPDSKTSILDKIVPWYYNRLDGVTGGVKNSTCCSNTAPEHAMMEKLITDSLVVWAREYKVDSFRFDLMGHHPLLQIQHSLEAVKKVDPNTYFYGEGWNFGEVANDALFKQATQKNLAGTGIGSYSDRLRDAVRGGTPFDDKDNIRKNQGFGNGAYALKNDISETSKADALHNADIVRLGMAGNLKDFVLIDSLGTAKRGDQIDYNGQSAGYATDPTEVLNYVSKHDNQTLWDNNQYKIGYAVKTEDRVRMQAISLATVMLGQGVPFTQMGAELLRSKSMQRDSYDSGDWYNKVDFNLEGTEDNNWNKGLPRKDKDGSNYDIITKVIETAGENAKSSNADINQMDEFFKELTDLRQQYPLITLGKGSEVTARVDFHNTGADQVPGLIVMSINNGTGMASDIDSSLDAMVIVINATPEQQDFTLNGVTGLRLSPLHKSKLASGATVKDSTLSVPAWSPAVFIQPRGNARGAGIPVVAKN